MTGLPANDTNRGLALLYEGKVSDAVAILRTCAWNKPSYNSYLNLAVALRHAGQFDSALDYLYKCVKLDDYAVNAWLAFANTYTDMGEWQEALFSYEAAWYRVNQQGLLPEHVRQVAIGYSQALLRDRQLAAGWPLWELGRYERSYWALPGTKRWLGEECGSLLVLCEGGYGDAMLFGRWLPFAKSKTKRLKLIVWDPLVSFRDWHALGVDEVLPKSQPVDPAGIDYTTSWMSLPGLAGVDKVAEIPEDEGLRKPFENYFIGALSMQVGFCWRAEESGLLRKTRSLPVAEAEYLARILGVYGDVISLCPQKKELYRPADERWPDNVLQDESLFADWQTTASTIRSCKFVVTVDTAIAHLSGLCGVPTLLLLSKSSDWKWGLWPQGTESFDPWYGAHVKYFRNPDPLSWQVDQIVEAVNEVA